MSPQKSASSSASKQNDPEEIQKDIEGSREELGDTVEAIADKADVKAQVKARVDAAKSKAEELGSRAKEAAPESVGAGAEQMVDTARENPMPVAGAFMAGIVLGWLLSR